MTAISPKKNPSIQIGGKNPWYISDHFEDQWQNPVSKRTILQRWKIWGGFIDIWLAEQNELVKDLKLKVLDAGCGDGINLMGLHGILSKRGHPFSLYGCDYNPLRLERVIRRFENISVTQGSLLQMPFRDNRFHIILCNAVLEHITEDAMAIKELYRILDYRGILIIGVPNEGCFLAKIRNHLLQPSISKFTDHSQFYIWPILQAKFLNAGLVPFGVKRRSFFMPHMRLNKFFGSYRIGDMFLNLLGDLFPSQVAEFQIYCKKTDV